jgi:4-amino-4-deoxy-L-arabinose transferase-like glycosyltransferase
MLDYRELTIANKKSQSLRYFFLLLLVVVPLYSLGLSNHGLWSADEPRVAEIGLEMALTGKKGALI